jgi:hypothetical protein
VAGVISLLVVCLVFSLPLLVGAAAASDGSPDGGVATMITGLVALLIGGVFGLIGLANLVVGWGLWQRKEWARVAAMGLAIVRLLNVPFGTIIGVLIIWYLLQDGVRAEFDS